MVYRTGALRMAPSAIVRCMDNGMTHTVRTGTELLWSALGGDPALTDRVEYGGPSGLL